MQAQQEQAPRINVGVVVINTMLAAADDVTV